MKTKRFWRWAVILAAIGTLSPALLGAGPAEEEKSAPMERTDSQPASQEKTQPSSLTWESPVFLRDGGRYRPQEELERDGKRFRLISARLQTAVKKGEPVYLSASVPYALEGRQEPPETAVVAAIDETSGEEYEREVPRLGITETDIAWSDDFSFAVTVTEYGADSFYLGETEIPAGQELADYSTELLAALGLPEDCYRIHAVVWEGDPYEQDGVLCRDAQAKGEKLVRTVEVQYGGQVQTPDVQGQQYIGIYEEILPESEPETGEPETEAKAEAETGRQESPSSELPPPGPGERWLRWLTEHLTVVSFGAGFFLFLLAAALLLWKSGKEEQEAGGPGN